MGKKEQSDKNEKSRCKLRCLDRSSVSFSRADTDRGKQTFRHVHAIRVIPFSSAAIFPAVRELTKPRREARTRDIFRGTKLRA